ncbi:RluA family pseudouridine synthase [Sphingomonas sp. LY29]|uniref:RluA family pseudouridine synthase n=1 Tax=Sphingomonas sp. LY29 TaxID=3095341 RepID=UPI002D79C877|nr:RluA family pseudouridine synthase [Sphingomonas sp. LY29]WRP26902.1 RluA family pseudouridine synthase [Sphingomonas sp. LY29]
MTAPPSDTVRTFTVGEDDDGIRLDRWFKRHLSDTSFNTVSRWARTGQLRVDGKRATPGDRLTTGMVLRVPPAEPAPAEGPGARPQRIVEPLTADEAAYVQEMVMAKGRDWFVLNKPPGLATQGGTKTVQHLDRLLDGLADDEGNRPKLVHRLDKDTSGVLLVARSARAAGHFAKSFSGRTARKVYWALITGVPSADEGVIDAPLAKQPGTGGEKMHVDEENGLPARTRYRLIDRAGNRAAWVELQPMTGRTHQLRAHMAAIGHPIVGDAKYGGAEAFLTGGISRKMHLHARRLRIDGVDGKPIDQTAELPSHFAESLATLGFEAMAGDMMPLDNPDPAKLPETKAKRVAAAAKTARKARKGERRGRGGPPAGKPTKSGRPARPSKPTKPRRP